MSNGDFQKRASDTPDQWTLAWIRKQFEEVSKGYRGATHGVNRALALYDDFVSELAAVRKMLEDSKREHEEDRAKIGELSERVKRMADYLNSIRKNGDKGTLL